MSTDPRRLRVAVCADLHELDLTVDLARLEAAGHTLIALPGGEKEHIISGAAEAEALLLGYGQVDDEVLEALPRLEIVALASMGFDNVDLDAARRRGVVVTNIVGAATEEVATHALTLMLDVLRGTVAFDRSVREGQWTLAAAPMPRRMSDLTLGVVGLGRIGMALIERARALVGRITGFDPFLSGEQIAARQVEPCSLQELLTTSDVVSLHLPLTAQTQGMIGADALAAMPAGAVLINVSRGGLVDSSALAAALDSGTLSGAGLDVLDEEPPTAGHPLVGHPKVVLTPHAGFLSDAALRDYARLQTDNVLAYAATGTALSPL